MVPKGSLSMSRAEDGRGRCGRELYASPQGPSSNSPAATLSAWRHDWPWQQRPEVNSAPTKVLVIAAVWAAPVEGNLVRTVA